MVTGGAWGMRWLPASRAQPRALSPKQPQLLTSNGRSEEGAGPCCAASGGGCDGLQGGGNMQNRH